MILDGVKDIFIPDSEYIQNAFDSFTNELKMKFNVDTGAFETLFTSEQPVTDTYTDYSIYGVGNFNLKIFDSKYFVEVVTFFRPFIRGWLVLMMLLYHIKQLISFFGYDAGVIQGRSEWISYNKSNTGGHKE